MPIENRQLYIIIDEYIDENSTLNLRYKPQLAHYRLQPHRLSFNELNPNLNINLSNYKVKLKTKLIERIVLPTENVRNVLK